MDWYWTCVDFGDCYKDYCIGCNYHIGLVGNYNFGEEGIVGVAAGMDYILHKDYDLLGNKDYIAVVVEEDYTQAFPSKP